MKFITQDIYLTAALIAQGIPLIAHSRTGSVTTFQFTETDELKQLVENYYADTARVSPLKYGNAFKNLKAMIHQTYTTNNDYITHNHNKAN